MVNLGLARRFSLPSITEPPYHLEDVPVKCRRDLEGSIVVKPTRDEWQACMAEMLLVCNEAISRRVASLRARGEVSSRKRPELADAKPLSLEYMADRLDVDDPLRGYQVIAVLDASTWASRYFQTLNACI